MNLTILEGPGVFSEFRMDAVVRRLRGRPQCPPFSKFQANRVFAFVTEESPGPDMISSLMELLGAVGPHGSRDGFFVVPRKGTISPWSTKATDILHNCGWKEIQRVERGTYYRIVGDGGAILDHKVLGPVLGTLYDRMTEGVYESIDDLFERLEPTPLVEIDLEEGGHKALEEANRTMGLALSADEIDYLYNAYTKMGRSPTDVELVMFGQVNSEHCRHKIFNANWVLDGEPYGTSLFGMIKQTHEAHPEGTLVAYSDNASVIMGRSTEWFEVSPNGARAYRYIEEEADIVMKVETHNHPTAISPFPGAATGVGGEIRDEGATGIGARSKAGLAAFMVSNLRIPGFEMPWEKAVADFPERLATPLQIMMEGPIGGAAFGNEFGRPQLTGIFKTYEEHYNGRYRGYHKPIMAAGGVGNIKRSHASKKEIHAGALIAQLGGPAMRIGLGGGAASSMDTGSNTAELDFNSVQRENPEMQRRCQSVIDGCIALGEQNPILSIHDIGAGGLSNGCPELVEHVGAQFWLRRIHNEEPSMSPMEIWCNESQERYVLALKAADEGIFTQLCARERCPVAFIGTATGDGRLRLHDDYFDNDPIDIDLDVVLGNPPKLTRDVKRGIEDHERLDFQGVSVADAAERVLRLPAVANKTFLITIADRSVSGLVARDQMVGAHQTPVSDVAVTTAGFRSVAGEAMAMGERTNVALVSAPASGRLAIAEALTNIAAAPVGSVGNVKLSANWMCACGEEGEDANLFDTVRAVAEDMCPRIGISIPVGKDSLSMRTVWSASDGTEVRMVAPLSLLVTAFAPVEDVRRTQTPDLKKGDSELLLLDLGAGRNRLGGSALSQVYNQVGGTVPDVDTPEDLKRFFDAVQELIRKDLILAYHDRSDGGLFVTLVEMAMSARRGFVVDLDELGADPLTALFAEEVGAVLQVPSDRVNDVRSVLESHAMAPHLKTLGRPDADLRVVFRHAGKTVYEQSVTHLLRAWSELTYQMQNLRDNPEAAREEFDNLLDESDPGLVFGDPPQVDMEVRVATARLPIAVLREQGVNGHVEMAAAFESAGFESRDVHMSDLVEGRVSLADCIGLVACGGFSYGDVLGAGTGWARSVLNNAKLADEFQAFFAREETFALGVCNGCQMLSQLKSIIPGADSWPRFTRNTSEQFEARLVMVEILESPSIFLRNLEGYRAAIPVAHGEGRAEFGDAGSEAASFGGGLVTMRFTDNHGRPTERYPFNPNGSPGGITGLCSSGGRVTIMMPHPERAFRREQLSYVPQGYRCSYGPWLPMFHNARNWVEQA